MQKDILPAEKVTVQLGNCRGNDQRKRVRSSDSVHFIDLNLY